MTSPVLSPCVARCKLNEADYCIGCYRHITEIVNWNKITDEQKRQTIGQLAARKAQVTDVSIAENTYPITRAKWLAVEKNG